MTWHLGGGCEPESTAISWERRERDQPCDIDCPVIDINYNVIDINCNVTDINCDVITLMTCTGGGSRLESVDISYNRMGDIGITSLARAVSMSRLPALKLLTMKEVHSGTV